MEPVERSPSSVSLIAERQENREAEEDSKPAARSDTMQTIRELQLATKSSHEDTKPPVRWHVDQHDDHEHGDTQSKKPSTSKRDTEGCNINNASGHASLNTAGAMSIHKELAVKPAPQGQRPTMSSTASSQTKGKDMSANGLKASPKAQRTASRKRRAPKEGQAQGRWTNAEHQAFLVGLSTHGREWKRVAADIPTRTSAQVRSHAQKYFAKIQREEEESVEKTQESVILPPAVQANVDRILAQPDLVQAEVQETMERLRRRYRQLQRRLHRADQRGASDDRSTASNSTISTLQNEELIALSVLHGSLPKSRG